MSTIVLHIEDKVSTDILLAFRRLAFYLVFSGVVSILLVYFQLDVVISEMVTVLLVHAYGTIVIFWRYSVASKFFLDFEVLGFSSPFLQEI